MSWPQKEIITPSVVDMLQVNMNLRAGEKLLVVSDVPRLVDWQQAKQGELTETLERVLLAPGGLMAVDYNQVAADCRRFSDL